MTKFKHPKSKFYVYLIIMKTISIFLLLIYWSIIIFAPLMSKDVKSSRAKLTKTKFTEQKPFI